MKAYEILEEAALLATGSPPDPLIIKSGTGLINTVLADLDHPSIQLLNEEVLFSHPGGDTVAVSGIAMLICILLGDDAGLSAFNELYHSSRSRFMKRVSRVKNTVFGGGRDEV